MNDLDLIEEAANEGNEPAVLQRQLIKVGLAIARRLDYIIAVEYTPKVREQAAAAAAKAAASQPAHAPAPIEAAPESPGFTRVETAEPAAEGENVDHPDFTRT